MVREPELLYLLLTAACFQPRWRKLQARVSCGHQSLDFQAADFSGWKPHPGKEGQGRGGVRKLHQEAEESPGADRYLHKMPGKGSPVALSTKDFVFFIQKTGTINTKLP